MDLLDLGIPLHPFFDKSVPLGWFRNPPAMGRVNIDQYKLDGGGSIDIVFVSIHV